VAELSHLQHCTYYQAKRPSAILPRLRPRHDRTSKLYTLFAQLGNEKTLRHGGEPTANLSYNRLLMENPASESGKEKVGVRQKGQLMSASEIDRTLVRLAHEIVERNNGCENLVFVGIRRRGVPLAERLARKIGEIEKVTPSVGTLDITFYRDDLSTVDHKPVVQERALPFSVEGMKVILVDDVLYTGRTTRAALDALVAQGRPQRVELCALVDRGHRELPIQADYVGRVVQTSDRDVIEVRLREVDNEERVMLCERTQ
jgi:pyrimidine operon attenuation protein/uracil phosphoribosyltransferase